MAASDIISPVLPLLHVENQDVNLLIGLTGFTGTWLLTWQRLNALQYISSLTTRKIIHISCGPLFLASWPFFTDTPSARLLACILPFSAMVLLAVSGSSGEHQSVRAALGRSISRDGKASEALQGPFYYSTVLFFSSLLLFKSPMALILVMQLCFGDGAAEIFGRKFGKECKWGFSWTGDKSIAGTFGFFISAFSGTCLGFAWWKYFNLETRLELNVSTLFALAFISAFSALSELAPSEVSGDDNLTIPVAAIAATWLSFGMVAL